jgi:hypothetical protein
MHQHRGNGRVIGRVVLMAVVAGVAAITFAAPRGGFVDCNMNGTPDDQDIAKGESQDCNGNEIPDECDIDSGVSIDCNLNGVPDACDVAFGPSEDCNGNEIPDECEDDCNLNGAPDDCDVFSGASEDCNNNQVPDECEPDCNGNGVPDLCDVLSGFSDDCNFNNIPDECDLSLGLSDDCNDNGIPDECDMLGQGADCNGNGLLDECDILEATSQDCNGNGTPDECEFEDCNENGLLDVCDITAGDSEDCNRNGVPDECEVSFVMDESGVLSPIGDGSPQSHTIFAALEAGGTVVMTFVATGDFGAGVEFVTVDVNGTPVGTIFDTGASDCPPVADTAELQIEPEVFNAAVAGGDAVIGMTASAAVDATPVLCSSSISVNTEYTVVTPGDLDGNGIPDVCEGCTADIAGPAGEPDGNVDALDFLILIGQWGTPCTGTCEADITGATDEPDGNVDALDFLELIGQWGSPAACP